MSFASLLSGVQLDVSSTHEEQTMADPRPGLNDDETQKVLDRRDFIQGAMTTAAAFAVGLKPALSLQRPPDDVIAQIAIQHDQTVKMLQNWIALPSIAAENRGYPQGAEYMANLVRD